MTKKVLKTEHGKVVLKFKPPKPKPNVAMVKAIIEKPAAVASLRQEREIIKGLIRGKSFEAMSYDMGISTAEAYATAKAAVSRWITDLQVDAPQAKALDLQRLDALLVILWQRAEPQEVLDGATGNKVLVPGDLGAAKVILDVIRLRADIYGYEAAKKMEVEKTVEHLHRLYIGASPDDL